MGQRKLRNELTSPSSSGQIKGVGVGVGSCGVDGLAVLCESEAGAGDEGVASSGGG